jgi:hypothetical protein
MTTLTACGAAQVPEKGMHFFIGMWALMKKLPLNKDKTKVMTITGNHLSKKIDRLPNVFLNGRLLDNVNCASLCSHDAGVKTASYMIRHVNSHDFVV